MKPSIQTFPVGASVALEVEVQGWRKNTNELRCLFLPYDDCVVYAVFL